MAPRPLPEVLARTPRDAFTQYAFDSLGRVVHIGKTYYKCLDAECEGWESDGETWTAHYHRAVVE